MERIVLDTNVLISAMRSRRGPAFRLVSLLGTGRFEISLSVALALEYESVLGRATALSAEEIVEVLDFLCSIAVRQKVFFLWRPKLRDPGDDLVLELAVASRSRTIVTFNQRDFAGAEQFGINVLSPARFLREIGEEDGNPERQAT